MVDLVSGQVRSGGSARLKVPHQANMGLDEEKKSMLLVMRVLSILPLNFKVSVPPPRDLG